MTTTANHAAAGTYYPNEAGARTLAESRSMVIDGKLVSANVANDGTYTVFIGGDIVETGKLDGTEGDLMEFFRAAALVGAVDLSAVAADVTEQGEEELTEAVAQIRRTATEMTAQADQYEATAARMEAKPSNADERNPRHPKHVAARYRRAAEGQRRDAAVFAAWTNQDEKAYSDYVSQGLADTNGFFAPLDRSAWKRTIGA